MNTTNYDHLTPPRRRRRAGSRSTVRATQHWRGALGDFQTYVSDTTPAAQLSLPDRMKPIIKQAEGVLEDAIAYEAARLRRREAKSVEHGAVSPEAVNRISMGPGHSAHLAITPSNA